LSHAAVNDKRLAGSGNTAVEEVIAAEARRQAAECAPEQAARTLESYSLDDEPTGSLKLARQSLYRVHGLNQAHRETAGFPGTKMTGTIRFTKNNEEVGLFAEAVDQVQLGKPGRSLGDGPDNNLSC
jgi:hypothetical protein